MEGYSWIIILGVLLETLIQTVGGVQQFYHTVYNESAVQGSTILLRCTVKNKGNGKVQWTRGGFGLGTEKSLPVWPRYRMIGDRQELGNDVIEEFSLKITDLQLEDDEAFSCQVMTTNEHMGIVSPQAWVTVLVPPSQPILDRGITIPVTLDKPTNVTCQALNGKPHAQISWKKDDIPIRDHMFEIYTTQPDGKRVDTTGKVTITAQLSDAGKKIECGAWNEALEAGDVYWTQATLDVQYAPQVRMSHNNPDRTMREYDDVKFTCTGEANPFEIAWKWYRDGELIEDESTNILHIPQISREYHGSIIKCEATNAEGSSSKQHSMNILYGPKFKNDIEHVSVDRGQRAELRCEADGNPTAEITWRRQGKHQVLHSSSTYVIPSVRDGMFGVYTCTATVLGFVEISRDIYLTENGPPEIVSDAVQYTATGDDETARIQCMAISSPTPVFIWTRNGQPIDYASSGKFSAPEEGLPYGGKSVLQILGVQEEDLGVYNCTVNNGKGTAVKLIKLEEKKELPIQIIVASASGGVAVIIAIILTCIIYHKCQRSDNESYAETDSNTEIKKRDKNESPSEMTKSTLMDQWRQDYNYRYSADFDEPDSKGNNNGYGNFVPDRYATMPPNYTDSQICTDHHPENNVASTIPRYAENSYTTGYIPSTFRSPSRTDFTGGRVSANDFNSGRVSANDFASGRVSTTDFTGRMSTEPLEPFRLPTADYSTTKLATNV